MEVRVEPGARLGGDLAPQDQQRRLGVGMRRCYLHPMVHAKRSSGSVVAGKNRKGVLTKVIKGHKGALAKARAALRAKRLREAMTKKGPRLLIEVVNGSPDLEIRSVRFGGVTASNTSPDAATLVINVRSGSEALGRAKYAFTKPGVKLQHRAEVPTFRVDARNPSVLIREVNGRIDRGRIVNGTFVAAE